MKRTPGTLVRKSPKITRSSDPISRVECRNEMIRYVSDLFQSRIRVVSGIRHILLDSWYSQNRIVGKKDRAKIGDFFLQIRRNFQIFLQNRRFVFQNRRKFQNWMKFLEKTSPKSCSTGGASRPSVGREEETRGGSRVCSKVTCPLMCVVIGAIGANQLRARSNIGDGRTKTSFWTFSF